MSVAMKLDFDSRSFRQSRTPATVGAGVLFAAAVLVSGCQALLPEADASTTVEWGSFDEARQTIDSFVPYKTHKEDLTAKGIDPYLNPAVSLLSYSDILQRFASSSAVRREDFDPGIRDCVSAGKRCIGYSIAVKKVRKERVGNFWLDSLNFRREIDITGWTFNGLVILVDDVVVYTLYSGQPNLKDRENTRNPLGPLQTWGDQVPGLLR
jgi:hypothetical protein